MLRKKLIRKENMAEIKHNLLSSYLSSLTSEKTPPIFFIWGEEFLCRKVFDAVISFLLPENRKELCYELLEGEDAVIPALIERICTYSFFQEKKVVAIKNAPLFTPSGTLLTQGFLNSDLENLQNLIEKGFPEGHYLVVTSENVDKRRTLFNAIKTLGVAVDCSVSQGNSKAEKEEQSEILRLTMMGVLDRRGKGIDGDALQALTELTGFDPVAFSDNLERLTSFIGDRDNININDVHSVVKRSKKEPIFELTNAVAQKDLESSLFYYKSLCDNGFHPLQLLSSIVNQIRKIFAVKIFIINQAQKGESCWVSANKNYQQFVSNTMPYITRVDSELDNILLQWSQELTSKSDDDYEADSNEKDEVYLKSNKVSKGKKKGSTKKSAVNRRNSDLIIASNPKSAYPVYQTFLRADKFNIDELVIIIAQMSDIDYKLKSSSDGDPFIVLEEMIIRICTNSFQKTL